MTKHTLSFAAAAAVALAALGATDPARAETVVKVSLTGEGGDRMGMDLSASTVPAGKVRFEVVNAAKSTGHEMVVIKLASKDEKLPLDPAKHRIDEKAVESMGEVSGLKAGQRGALAVDLAPGDYELICNHKGHYEAGMRASLTVTP